MKLLSAIFFILIVSIPIFAQSAVQTGKLYAVIEYRHDSKLITNAPDLRTGEMQALVRYMTSCTIGFSAVVRMNDTSSNVMGGVTFMPVEWVRFDVLGGSRVQDQSQKSIFGFRFWAGNSWQNFWFNIDGGSAPVWFEGIYTLSVTKWLDIGAMGQTVGVGPRVDLNLPVFANGGFKVWGALIGNWYNTNASDPNKGGYNPKALHAMIGVKAIF